jgi:hypothetical protein
MNILAELAIDQLEHDSSPGTLQDLIDAGFAETDGTLLTVRRIREELGLTSHRIMICGRLLAGVSRDGSVALFLLNLEPSIHVDSHLMNAKATTGQIWTLARLHTLSLDKNRQSAQTRDLLDAGFSSIAPMSIRIRFPSSKVLTRPPFVAVIREGYLSYDSPLSYEECFIYQYSNEGAKVQMAILKERPSRGELLKIARIADELAYPKPAKEQSEQIAE